MSGVFKPVRIVLLLSLVFSLIVCSSAQAGDKIKVVIDADPAHGYMFKDVDDGLAIALALNSPELEVMGITATFANASGRRTYKKAVELVKAAGLEDQVPVLRGAHSHRDRAKATEAGRFIAKCVNENPGEVTIIALGALTNVATAIADPTVSKNVKRIVIMGGAKPVKYPLPPIYPLEINWNLDPVSTRAVLESGIHIVQTDAELCKQVIFTPDHYERLKTEAPFLRDYLAKNISHWVGLNKLRIEGTPVAGFYPWDVVTVFYVLRAEAFDKKYYRLRMEGNHAPLGRIEGHEVEDPAEANVMAPSRFDADLFWEIFFERI